MATSTLGLPRGWTQTALPVLVGLLSVSGTAVAATGLLQPEAAPRLFGIILDPIASSDPKYLKGLTPSQKAYVYIHNIRNLASGISLGALTLFWQFSASCQNSPALAEGVKRALGITLICGPIVGLGDAWILANYAKADGPSKEAVEVGKEKSLGHAITAMPILALGLALFFT